MTRRLPRFARLRAGALSVLGSAALLAACETPLPTSAEVERMDVAAAETQVQRLAFIASGDGDVTYFVDGVQVSAEEARAIAGDYIAQLEVHRAASAGAAQIRITTREGGPGTDPEVAALIRELESEFPAGEGEREVRVLRLRSGGEPGATLIPSAEQFDGLLIIDGAVSPSSALRDLRPDRIERVQVIKGDAATRQYDDPRAAQGVIRITTKSAPAP